MFFTLQFHRAVVVTYLVEIWGFCGYCECKRSAQSLFVRSPGIYLSRGAAASALVAYHTPWLWSLPCSLSVTFCSSTGSLCPSFSCQLSVHSALESQWNEPEFLSVWHLCFTLTITNLAQDSLFQWGINNIHWENDVFSPLKNYSCFGVIPGVWVNAFCWHFYHFRSFFHTLFLLQETCKMTSHAEDVIQFPKCFFCPIENQMRRWELKYISCFLSRCTCCQNQCTWHNHSTLIHGKNIGWSSRGGAG